MKHSYQLEAFELREENARLTEENKRLREFCKSLQLDVSNEVKLEQLLSELEFHEKWLTEEVNKAYDKIESGEAEFYSSELAEQIMALRKKEIKGGKDAKTTTNQQPNGKDSKIGFI